MKKKFLILYNREIYNVVTSNKIIYKLWSIEERYQEKMEYTSKWWYRFMYLLFLTFRRNTHVVQNPPKNYLGKIQEFLFII